MEYRRIVDRILINLIHAVSPRLPAFELLHLGVRARAHYNEGEGGTHIRANTYVERRATRALLCAPSSPTTLVPRPTQRRVPFRLRGSRVPSRLPLSLDPLADEKSREEGENREYSKVRLESILQNNH